MVSRAAQNRAFQRNEEKPKSRAKILNDDVKSDFDLSSASDDIVNDDKKQDTNTVLTAIESGAITKTIAVFGHQVTFHALNTKEELQAYSLAKPLQDTKGYDIALQTAYFALSVDSIDSTPFYMSIAADASEPIARYQLACKYYSTFIAEVFKQYVSVKIEQDKQLAELGK